MESETEKPLSALKQFAREIDTLLRGGFTREEHLRAGTIAIPVRTLILAGLVLGGLYGVMMGLYALSNNGVDGLLQLLATTVKVPLLFFLTLLITCPSLYVFSALARSRLSTADTQRLLLAAIAINLAVLASFGPVTAFFTLSTRSYPFMVLLNVVFFGVAGLIGLVFLNKALTSVFEATPDPTPPPDLTQDASQDEAGAKTPELESMKKIQARRAQTAERDLAGRVFAAWLAIYCVVGAQMGWVLRPFVGSPDLPFQLFRPRESNFLAAVFRALSQLFE